MNLQDLTLYHRLKTRAEEDSFPTSSWLPQAFRFETCQRVIWIQKSENAIGFPDHELFEGTKAYDFLLRVASGLESSIAGETDVFGQLKQAWKNCETDPHFSWLSPILQRVFEDTKVIRSIYLQGNGGSSYGSLSRKLIPTDCEKPVLVLGAGKLSRSISPYLTDLGLILWNRSPDRALALKASLLEKAPSAKIEILEDLNEKEIPALFSRVGVILICAPIEVELFKLIQSESLKRGILILAFHLRDADRKEGEVFKTLDDLFRFQGGLGDARTLLIEKAKKACFEKATLRSLGGAGISHGWEDLAWFK